MKLSNNGLKNEIGSLIHDSSFQWRHHIGVVNYETGEAHDWDETFASSIKVGEWGILNNFEHLSIQNSASSRGALQFRIT